MNINKIIISNFKGISSPIHISPAQFACIVGKNDMGKSTILKAPAAFLAVVYLFLENPWTSALLWATITKISLTRLTMQGADTA